MDFYSITSQCKSSGICFDPEHSELDSVKLSLNQTTAKCTICRGDVYLSLPPGIQNGSLLLSFTVSGSNSDFILFSGEDFSQYPFFINFFVYHPNAIPLPSMSRYVVKISNGQVLQGLCRLHSMEQGDEAGEGVWKVGRKE